MGARRVSSLESRSYYIFTCRRVLGDNYKCVMLPLEQGNFQDGMWVRWGALDVESLEYMSRLRSVGEYFGVEYSRGLLYTSYDRGLFYSCLRRFQDSETWGLFAH